MKTQRFNRCFALVVVFFLLVGMLPVSAMAAETSNDAAETNLVGTLEKSSAIEGTDYIVTSVKNYAIAPDISERVITTNNLEGTSQTVVNVMEVNPNNGYAKIVTGYGKLDPTNEGWTMMTTTNQAHLYENAYGENVVGGVNASWFNINTGEPSGMLVMRGVTHHDSTRMSYIASFSDGSVNVFAPGTTRAQAEEQQSAQQGQTVTMTEAVDGSFLLVWDGEPINSGGNDGYYPRTAVGIKADGTVVILQADGTMAPRSVGYTVEEEAKLMVALGCVKAIRLDEGGSSTYLSQREGESDLSMRNTPAGGSERSISGSVLVVSTAPSTGEFDHVSITPNSEIFTPNSTVELEAVGMDYSGALANGIPADVTWALDDPGMGTLSAGEVSGNTASAVFSSNGTLGTATVSLKNGSKVVGTVTVRIQDPDSLAFSSDEVNLVYSQSSDLGLVAKYAGEPVNLKAGDITWSITDEAAGSFDGNTFTATADKKYSGSPIITAAYGSLSDTVTVNIGKQPVMIMDGGDEDIWDYSTIGTTVESFEGMAANAVATYHYSGRNGVVKGSIVSDTDEEYADIVRFGHNAIKLEYDWSGLTGTDGACLGLGDNLSIDGTPTAIGVWVYIPDETTPVPWLRAQIATSSNGGATWTNAYINFNAGTAADGMKVGWQYLEADLTQYAGTLIRVNSGMLFRAMAGASTGFGWYTVDGTALQKSELHGYILLDNLSIVYGANNQDVTPPTVSSIALINGDGSLTELENDAVIDTQSFNLYVTYNDNEDTDDNATGVESAYFYLDGIYVGEGIRDNLGSTLTNVTMTNGQHSVTFYLKDGFGNITRETRYFTVENTETTTVSLEIPAEPAVGKVWQMNLTSNDPTDLAQLEATVSISKGYSASVTFPEGVNGSYTFNESRGLINISISDVTSSDSGVLAAIDVQVSANVTEGSTINVQVTKGSFTSAKLSGTEAAENLLYWAGFTTEPASYPITATYNLTADMMIQGPAFAKVTKDGSSAEGVKVYCGEDLIGVSDSNGKVDISSLSENIGNYSLYAVDDEGNYSFTIAVPCYAATGNEDGSPYYILSNMVSNAGSEKNISWMSNPVASKAKAEIRVSVNADMSDAVVYTGTSTMIGYSRSNVANRVNSVYVTGLAANTTYYYQVGDGEIWSEVRSFTTASANDVQTNFFLMADIQEQDAIDGLGRIANLIQNDDYDFGVQLGDAVDNVRMYNEWEDTLNLFSLDGFSGLNFLHVIGNHETDDDGNNAIAAKRIYNLAGDWYSVEYGDVYVAVLNHTMDQGSLERFKEWLVADASASDCAWKVLVTHVPVYYTNPTGGGETYLAMLPEAIQAAGIDFFFAGNDHSYARTAPLTDGAVDETNGVVYYICGSTGGKSYAVVDNPDFHFEVATLDFNSVYVSVSANENYIEVTTYNVGSDGTATVLDTYRKGAGICENDEHTFTYDRESGELQCSVCGFTCDAKEEMWSGWATDKETGYAVYLAGGSPVTGDMRLDTTEYYFDQNGLSYNGTVVLCGENCEFEDGKFVGAENGNVWSAGFSGLTVEWVLYRDGTLVLGGSGAMKDATTFSAVPWSDYRKQIVSVTVGEEITSLGNYAFYKSTQLKTVNFAENGKLQSINKQVFLGCTSLTSITIPDTVVTLGSYMFNSCTALQEVVLPENLKTISSRMFEKCAALTYVYVPDGVSQIVSSAFNNCPNIVLSVAKGSYAETFAKSAGIAYTVRAAAVLYSGSCGENVTWSLYADGVFKLEGSGAMTSYATKTDVPWYVYRTQIKEVVISKDITTLSKYAFYKATNLETVSFEEGSVLTSIGNQTFIGCTKLTAFDMPDTVTSVGTYVFSGCTKLESVVLSESLKSLPTRVFENCTALTSVYIPDGVIAINANTFAGADNVVLSVAKGSYAETFAKNAGIAYTVREAAVLYSGSCGENVTWSLYADGVFKLEGSGAMTDYATKTDVPWYAYRAQVKDVVIGKDITTLSKYAFYKATNLESVTFEEGSVLTSIGNQAFIGCTKLTAFDMPDTVTSVGTYVFSACTKLESVVLSESLKSLPTRVFENCTALTSVYVPDGMTSINAYTFAGADKVVLSVAKGSYGESFAKSAGIAYTVREAAVLYSGSCGENVSWSLYADGVFKLEGSGAMTAYASKTDVPWYAYRAQVKDVVIGKDVTELSKYAFYKATNLESVTFEEGSVLTSIGNQAFIGCTKLTAFDMPDTVTSVGTYVFSACTKLESVVLSESLKSLPTRVFENCTALTSVYIPDGMTAINAYTFAGADNVVLSVAKGSYAETFAKSAGIAYTVREAAVLYSGSCGENVSWSLYADGVFKLEGSGAMTAYASKTDVPWYAYRAQVKDVVISKDVTELSKYAFYKATNLETVTFEEGSVLTSIGNQAFIGCTKLTAFDMPDTVTSVGTYVFSGCTKLESVELSESLKSLPTRVFGNCTALTSVYIPDGMSSINAYTFAGADNVVLSVAKGSYAEGYAQKMGIAYISREAEEPVTEPETPVTEPETPVTEPETPVTEPETPVTEPEASATEPEEPVTTPDEKASESSGVTESVKTENSCGENLTWDLTDGVLTIAGSGEMDTYSEEKAAPWSAESESIKAIVIGEDVESIGAYAFNGLSKVETVSFAENSKLKAINDYAFSGCEELKAIFLPENLELIGEAAFNGCTALEAVEIYYRVTSIGVRTIETEEYAELVPIFNGCDYEKLVVVVYEGSVAESVMQEMGIQIQFKE